MAYPSVTNNFSNNSLINAVQCNQNFSDVVSGITDGTKDMNISNFSSSGNAYIGGDIYTVVRYAYTSATMAGWVGTPTNFFSVKKLGNIVELDYYITGTSNSPYATFTLPYNYASASIFNTLQNMCYINAVPSSGLSGTAAVGDVTPCIGMLYLTSNNVANIRVRVMSFISGGDGTTFASSNVKTVSGTLIYESE